jgi:hypothetical protein
MDRRGAGIGIQGGIALVAGFFIHAASISSQNDADQFSTGTTRR